MRRWLGVVAIVALVAVLYPRIAFAEYQPQLFAASPADFRSQLFKRVFDEATAADAYSSELAESFFRSYAFRVAAIPVGTGTASIAASDDASLPALSSNLFQPVSNSRVARIGASAYHFPTIAAPQAMISAEPSPVVGLYQDTSPQPTTAPASFRFDLTNTTDYTTRLVTFSPLMNPQDAFTAGSSGPDASTTLPQAQAGVAVPVRVGRVRVQPHMEGAQADVPSLALHDNAVNTGATFNTRVGPQKLNVDLSSGFEHLTIDPQVNSSSFDITSNWQLAQGNLPVLIPAYADVSKRTISAGVGVPVTRNLTLNVQAETQHLQGGYGTPGLSNLDARNNVYGGQVTFQLPHSASAISLSAKQFHYQDNLTPNAYTQTSAGVDFTVKF